MKLWWDLIENIRCHKFLWVLWSNLMCLNNQVYIIQLEKFLVDVPTHIFFLEV